MQAGRRGTRARRCFPACSCFLVLFFFPLTFLSWCCFFLVFFIGFVVFISFFSGLLLVLLDSFFFYWPKEGI